MKKIVLIILILIILVTCFFIFNQKEKNTSKIRIMATNGIGHAPLYVMNELSLIEKYAPNAKLDLTIASSSNGLNEAFIANQTDFASFSISDFMIGLDKGIPYKISSALSYSRFGIQTNNPNIKTLKDVGPNDKVSITSLTGFSATLFYMACEKEFGDYKALENNIVVMDAVNGEMALINKSSGISLHVHSLSTILRENRAGCPTILDSIDILGEKCTSIIIVGSNDFVEKQPELYNAYLSALDEAVSLITNKDEQALEVMSKSFNISKEEIIENLDSGNLSFSTTEYNILPLVDFLYRTGITSTKIESLDEVSFPNVTAKR